MSAIGRILLLYKMTDLPESTLIEPPSHLDSGTWHDCNRDSNVQIAYEYRIVQYCNVYFIDLYNS